MIPLCDYVACHDPATHAYDWPETATDLRASHGKGPDNRVRWYFCECHTTPDFQPPDLVGKFYRINVEAS